MRKKYSFVQYIAPSFEEAEMQKRSRDFFANMDSRRSVRDFSDRKVPREILENIIRTASTAPSGAHKQPWTFCLIQNPEIKQKIRVAAEKEELESYQKRMPEEWLADLEPLGTDWQKPFLETAPWLVVCFKRSYEIVDGKKRKNYYVNESVGLACGFFLTAVHQAGLVSLTHTPSPMDFLSKILGRPANERPFLLMPVGYPAEKVEVPDLMRKDLSAIMQVY
ncbi:MAG TPA: nitroreductase family protein [Bacteroidetes bacterium]|nr:nitroreductase family protein [Bacteroidota bacterium]